VEDLKKMGLSAIAAHGDESDEEKTNALKGDFDYSKYVN